MPQADQTRLLIVEDVPQVAQYIRGLLNAQSRVKLLDVLTDGSKAVPTIREHARLEGRRARRSTARLASAGCRATRPGGVLVLCSCSSAVSLGRSHARARPRRPRRARPGGVFDRCFQGADHPVPAAFPEGLYLKA